VVSLGFLFSPGKLSHCAKQAASTLGRQHLGNLLWDLAIVGKLFELWKGKVTKALMPSHESGLFVFGQKLDFLDFFGWW
jgi:hypothetical protein